MPSSRNMLEKLSTISGIIVYFFNSVILSYLGEEKITYLLTYSSMLGISNVSLKMFVTIFTCSFSVFMRFPFVSNTLSFFFGLRFLRAFTASYAFWVVPFCSISLSSSSRYFSSRNFKRSLIWFLRCYFS